ncbi:MAG: ATP-binding cassette domain-containing protein [Bacteroidales bacterium]|nr:ATP-binding cassette domain-containing protein [Bacteroidales bacterium]
MSESILKALVQLFALIAHFDHEGVTGSARDIVASFLKNQFGQALTDEYMVLFDEYFEKYQGNKGRKRISSNSVKVLAICSQINEELRQEQKILVLLQLLEFIHFGGEINETELEFLDTVAETFNIEASEYEDCKSLILSDDIESIPGKENILIINQNKEPKEAHTAKHRYHENLSGELVILHIKSTNTFVFGYIGEDNLFLNGQPITPHRAHILVKGSSIRSPKISPIYYSDIAGTFLQDSSKESIRFVAYNLEFSFPNSTNGLHNFNFCAEGGELIGVMGGSGAGKSTLLNIFNGTLSPKKGQVLINGYDVYKEPQEIEGVIGFVPQDDLLIEELTVFQNLYYNAKLCLNNFSEEEIISAVDKVLIDLDLIEIKSLKVGSPLNKFISGGQRKRLNIALELIREPSVLFVDEPTSGLSSNDSEMVMDLLKEQTLKGKLAIINIHQPSSDIYKLFDKLIVMDKGGHPIYYGNPIDAITYFKRASNYVNAHESECTTCGNVNPEQVLQIVESRVVDEYGKLTTNRKTDAKEWYKLYKEELEKPLEEPEKQALPSNFFKIPNAFVQFKIFSLRDIKSKLTNRQYLLLTFLEAPVLAVILGYFTKYIADDEYLFMYNENLPAYIFMAVVVALFLGLTVSAEEIIKDRKILQREKFLNLSRGSYINSKVLIQFFISAVQTLSFVLVGNLILGIKGLTLDYWMVLFATSAFANILGLNISAALNSVVTIYILIPFILVPQLLLSGVIVNFDKLHKSIASQVYVPFVGDLMTSRWAYEALAVNQFMNNKYDKNTYNLEQKISEYLNIYNGIIPELDNIITFANNNFDKPEEQETVREKILILRNETNILANKSRIHLPKKVNFDIKTWNKANGEILREYLNEVKSHFTQLRFKLSDQLDSKITKIQRDLGGSDELRKLKHDYHNINLNELMTAKNELTRIKEVDDRLIQKVDMIYKIPESKVGRAHLYAPYKVIGTLKIPTPLFNTIFIWITILILYITLRFNVLKRLLSIFERKSI